MSRLAASRARRSTSFDDKLFSPMVGIPATPEALLARLGQLVVRWNGVEDSLRNLLVELASPEGRHDIASTIVAFMGNVTLCDAIETLSVGYRADVRDHILYAIKLVQIMREYRNWYVHSSNRITLAADVLTLGVSQFTSKGEKRFYYGEVGEDDLIEVTRDLYIVESYLMNVGRVLFMLHASPESFQLPSWLEKPPQPSRLRKPLVSQTRD